MAEALKRIGGPPDRAQTKLAKALNVRFPELKTTPQAIQYLAKNPNAKRGGRLMVYISRLVDLPPLGEWSVSSEHPIHEAAGGIVEPVPNMSRRSVERAKELDGVEYTKEALEVAKAFMDLPRNLRDEFKRQIETEALRWTTPAIEPPKKPAPPKQKETK